MTIQDFDERMSQLDTHFKNAPEEAGFELPEPGNYQAVFREVDFFEKKDPPNNAFLKMVYEVVFDPKYQGRQIEMIYNLEPHKVTGTVPASPEEIEMKLGFLKRDLKTLGVDVSDEDFGLSRLAPGAPLWDELLDCTVELAIRDSKKTNPNTGKPYRNAFLNERTGDALPQSDVPVVAEPALVPADPASDDDIPF